MGDALNAALAEERAEDVTREIVPGLVASEVESRIGAEVGKRAPVLAQQESRKAVIDLLPGLVAAEYKANPPKDGVDGTTPDPAKDGEDGEDGEDGKSINWRGPWRRGPYAAQDAVELDGTSYIATAPTSRKPPAGDWDILAKKGKDGSDGKTHDQPITNIRGGGVIVQDEGTSLGPFSTENFVGAGVTVTNVNGVATVTIPGGGGGGSISVTDGTTTVNPATTLTLPSGSVTNLGSGNAEYAAPFYRQPSDPGAVGAGALWVDTTTPGTSDQHIQRRDATDTGWTDELELYVATNGIELDAGGDNNSVVLVASPGAATGGFADVSGGSSGGNHGGRFTTAGGQAGVTGGNSQLSAGSGTTGSAGGTAKLIGANGNDGDTTGAHVFAEGGDGAATNGRLELMTDASTGLAGQLLTAQGDTTALWGSVIAALIASGHQAAFVEPTTATPEAIANSLIACGLMAAA